LAGIGRIVDHNTAGIVRSMIHDAAGIDPHRVGDRRLMIHDNGWAKA
jgi:hypothetical protein